MTRTRRTRGTRGTRERGFAVLMALMVVVLVVGALVTVMRGSGALAFQTNQMLREAHSRNLHAGALAWTKRNPKALAALAPGKARSLTIECPGLSQIKLTVKRTVGPDGSGPSVRHVKVRGDFVLRGRPFRRETRYAIKK